MITVGKYIGHTFKNKKIDKYKILTSNGIKLLSADKIIEQIRKDELHLINMEYNTKTKKLHYFKSSKTYRNIVIADSDKVIFSLIIPESFDNFIHSYGYEYYFKDRNVAEQGETRKNADDYYDVRTIDNEYAEDIVTNIEYNKKKKYKLYEILDNTIKVTDIKPSELNKRTKPQVVKTWDYDFSKIVTLLTFSISKINITFKFNELNKITDIEITMKPTYMDIKKYLEA